MESFECSGCHQEVSIKPYGFPDLIHQYCSLWEDYCPECEGEYFDESEEDKIDYND